MNNERCWKVTESGSPCRAREATNRVRQIRMTATFILLDPMERGSTTQWISRPVFNRLFWTHFYLSIRNVLQYSGSVVYSTQRIATTPHLSTSHLTNPKIRILPLTPKPVSAQLIMHRGLQERNK